jgi:hypothetical protein
MVLEPNRAVESRVVTMNVAQDRSRRMMQAVQTTRAAAAGREEGTPWEGEPRGKTHAIARAPPPTRGLLRLRIGARVVVVVVGVPLEASLCWLLRPDATIDEPPTPVPHACHAAQSQRAREPKLHRPSYSHAMSPSVPMPPHSSPHASSRPRRRAKAPSVATPQR